MEGNAKHFRKRDAILTCLKETTVHPSAEWIYARLKPEIPDLSLATVYRNLNRFKEQGLIVSVGAVSGVERFDGNTKPHVHYICTSCGDVQDLHQVEVPDQLRAMVEKATGGRVDGCQLTFTGTCGECIKKQEVAV